MGDEGLAPRSILELPVEDAGARARGEATDRDVGLQCLLEHLYLVACLSALSVVDGEEDRLEGLEVVEQIGDDIAYVAVALC